MTERSAGANQQTYCSVESDIAEATRSLLTHLFGLDGGSHDELLVLSVSQVSCW